MADWRRALHVAKLFLGLGTDEDYDAFNRKHGLSAQPRWPEPTGWRRSIDNAGVIPAVITALIVLDTWWHRFLAAIAITLAIHIAAILLERLFGPGGTGDDDERIVTLVGDDLLADPEEDD